jgi:DNA-binding HxlR family transcriptional regulator
MQISKKGVSEKMIEILHHRWSLPLITEIYSDRGAKFLTLVNRLQISRDSLTRTLKSLVRQGWIIKNPGHGHPLRPEYILTSGGERIGPVCQSLVEKIRESKLEKIALNKWSLPILTAICSGETRFSELKKSFSLVTPRALTQTLKALDSAGLVKRVVKDSYPPSVEYFSTADGLSFCPLLADFSTALDE